MSEEVVENVAGELSEEDKARELLSKIQQEKVAACVKEVELVLKKHGCTLFVQQPEIRVVPLQKQV